MSESLPTWEPGESILEVDAISLSFKGVKAITDVSFQVGVEELFAIIGPNGLPVGVQLIGAHGTDDTLIRHAVWLESRLRENSNS